MRTSLTSKSYDNEYNIRIYNKLTIYNYGKKTKGKDREV